MNKQELLQRVSVEMIIDNTTSCGAFETEYVRSQEKILEDIHRYLQEDRGADQTLMNDIRDCIAISEEKAFVIGFCEGMKLMR